MVSCIGRKKTITTSGVRGLSFIARAARLARTWALSEDVDMDLFSEWIKTCDQLVHAEAALDVCRLDDVGDWATAIILLEDKCLELEQAMWTVACS